MADRNSTGRKKPAPPTDSRLTPSAAERTTARTAGSSVSDRLFTQRDELFTVMGIIYVLKELMLEREDGDSNYISRVLDTAHSQCDCIAGELDQIAAEVRHG